MIYKTWIRLKDVICNKYMILKLTVFHELFIGTSSRITQFSVNLLIYVPHSEKFWQTCLFQLSILDACFWEINFYSTCHHVVGQLYCSYMAFDLVCFACGITNLANCWFYWLSAPSPKFSNGSGIVTWKWSSTELGSYVLGTYAIVNIFSWKYISSHWPVLCP